MRSSGGTVRRTALLVAAGVAAVGAVLRGPAGGVRSVPAMRPSAPPATLAGKLVFVRAEAGVNALMLADADGRGPIRLGVRGTKPHVSPDGSRIAYATPVDALAVFELATGEETVLATPLSVVPRWSPDGKRILFWSDHGGTHELWTISADGSGAARLSDGGGGYHEADWSPDGSRIVFRRATGDGGDIWTMNADGTGAALLHSGPRMDSDPRWAPDGRRIAFVGTVPRSASAGFTTAIFVIDSDGSNLVRVTQGDAEVWSPAWTPDGSRIAFFGFLGDPDDADIATVRPDGTDMRVLLGGPTYDHGPAFGPAPVRRWHQQREES